VNNELLESRTKTDWRSAAGALLVCAVCGIALVPFLRLFEFSNGGENAVVASVQEIHRGGPWLVPTLHEEQRTKKPPLATWLSALAARPATTAKFSDLDPAVRREAYSNFAIQVRWPALMAMVGVLLVTYLLATQIGTPTLALCATIICGTTLFWLQSARLATTDANLALWVTLTNCLLTASLFSARPWPAFVAAGTTLGLAMMSKGPVALIQTVVPILAYIAWQRFQPKPERPPTPRPKWIAPLLVGVLLFMAIGLSWYVMVYLNNPEVIKEWITEVTREGATDLEPSKWYNYATLPFVLFPWTFFTIVGLIGSVMVIIKGARGPGRECASRIVLALFLLIVPILIMSLFRDRKMRYLIPLVAPASIIAAWGMLELLATVARRKATLMIAAFHWLPLAIATIGLGLAASPLGSSLPSSWTASLKTAGGEPWYSTQFGIVMAFVAAALIAAAMLWQRRAPLAAPLIGGAMLMLFWNAVFNAGYRHSSEGSSEMRPLAEQILAAHPDAEVYSYRPDRPQRHAPIDLAIYLNRAVKAVKDPAELRGTTGPRVFIVRQKHTEQLADPSTLAPAEGGPWTYFAATPVDEAIWYAFTSAP
jgi:4-amino-4-deoxy-L-arabinose transferase-like glycosyltransferase